MTLFDAVLFWWGRVLADAAAWIAVIGAVAVVWVVCDVVERRRRQARRRP